MRTRTSVASVLSVMASLTGCATWEDMTGGGLGSVSDDLVTLYDAASPEGLIEVEVNRDGSIREMEAEVAVEAVPDGIIQAARAKLPDAKIIGAEREFTAMGEGWEVKLEHDGRKYEYVMDLEGNVIETEEEIERSEAPQVVLDAADRAISGGDFKSVERIVRGGEQEYHVKKTKEGASYKIVLEPDGTVTRKVREARAEIEIPLQG